MTVHRTSDQNLEVAISAIRAVTNCTRVQAENIVHAIAAYIARYQDEMMKQDGPAWEQWLQLEEQGR